jgi:diguanylate cyclase (GGDEF)-like protein
VSVAGDAAYLRFRKGSVTLASLSAVAAGAMVAAYVAGTWGERPHRGTLLILVGVAMLSVVVIQVTRAERLVETRWCELFFACWSSLYVVMIAVLALLDGGVRSPLVVIWFPVLVFAGLCYPRTLAIFVGVACVAADLAVGLIAGIHDWDEALFVAGSLALTGVMCAWQAHTLDKQRRELALASRTDYLTGSLNRRGFHEHMTAELARAERSGEPLALLVVDLDGFKGVNDAHGHGAGDDLLRWVTDRLRGALRPSDAAARLGGDEFALILPGLDADGAGEVAKRLRDTLAARTPASFGAASYPQSGDMEALLAAADAELYRDKGRPHDGGHVHA